MQFYNQSLLYLEILRNKIFVFLESVSTWQTERSSNCSCAHCAAQDELTDGEDKHKVHVDVLFCFFFFFSLFVLIEKCENRVQDNHIPGARD